MTDPAVLQRLARTVLAAGLLLIVLGGGLVVALRAATLSPSVASRPPLAPIRLPASTIVVAPGSIDAPAGETAAPAAGVTGTTVLPAIPVAPAVAQAIVAGNGGVVPARPFAFGAATALDRGRALQCLTTAIYYEAATEPDAGQRAVAQVVLNRVRHPAFPATVCGVVYQGSERAGCQFSFACDGAMAHAPARAAWVRAAHVAGAALAGYVYAPVGLATHYHTYAVTPAWNRSLVMTDVVGAHFFHRWKGYWGTAQAFAQAYRGNEPEPSPHAPVTPPAETLPTPTQIAAATAGAPIPPLPKAAAVRPRPTLPDPRLDLPAAPVTDDSQILPRWRDSGKPIDPR
jgi:spore germination cell wall hydrolase CwlJ-like protein